MPKNYPPRLIRMRDAPAYVGMDRHNFTKLVRPYLVEIPLGVEGIALLSRLSIKGLGAKKPYPLSWVEQDKLFKELARHLANAALFGVNTGCREQEICQLRWD